MPLSRLTQTLPLDFAAEAWASEAAPVGAALVEVFLSGAGEDDAGALDEGLMEELLALAGAPPEGVAIPESLAAVLFFRLLFEVVVAVSVAFPG